MPTPTSTATQHKAFATKTIAVDLDARTVRHYITTPTVDEDGDVILPRGADLSRFTKARTVFDVHQYGSKDVVGTNTSLAMQDDGIVAVTHFAERPPENLWPADEAWWPDALLWMYHTGDIKGWSIGFSILDARNPTKQDITKWGQDVQRVITRWQMLEYSVAPLPCNGDALTLSMKGILSKRLADVAVKGKRPTRADLEPATDPAMEPTPTVPAPPQKVRIEIPAAAAPLAKKKLIFLMPAETPVATDTERHTELAAEFAVRRARGEMIA